MSQDSYYMQEALKLLKLPNSSYSPILNNVDTLLGPDVRSEFATVPNGNLLSKENSSEMRELVASALTANYRSNFGERKGADDFSSSDIAISPYTQKLDKYTTIKPGELFEGKYSISLNRHRKDKHGKSHQTATINATSIIEGIKKIKTHYDKIQIIYPYMKRVRDAIKENNSGKLTKIVQEITPSTQMTPAEVVDTVKFIYDTEQKDKNRSIFSSFKSLYNKIFKIDPKKQIADLFATSRSSLTVQDIETGPATGNIIAAQEQARDVVRNRPKASKVSTTKDTKRENKAVTADYPPL